MLTSSQMSLHLVSAHTLTHSKKFTYAHVYMKCLCDLLCVHLVYVCDRAVKSIMQLTDWNIFLDNDYN